jgi:hypothetical protein
MGRCQLNLVTFIEFISMIFVFVGVYYITIPRIAGIYWMIVAQVCWSVFAIMTGAWFLLAQNIGLMAFNVRGIVNWKKKGIK